VASCLIEVGSGLSGATRSLLIVSSTINIEPCFVLPILKCAKLDGHYQMKTKVLLTGTFDAGKTTIAEILARVPGVHVIPEYARELIARGGDLWRRPEFQEMVLTEQLRREAAAELRTEDLIVCDRGTVDVACFSQLFGHPYDADLLLSGARYDLIFVFSPDDIAADHLPPHMKQARWELEEVIETLLNHAGLPYCVIKGSTKARVGQLLDRLADRPGLDGIIQAARTLIQRKN